MEKLSPIDVSCALSNMSVSFSRVKDAILYTGECFLNPLVSLVFRWSIAVQVIKMECNYVRKQFDNYL